MNTTITENAGLNRFSWRRVWMIARYVYPAIKWQIIGYPVATFVLTVIYVAAMATGLRSVNVAAASGLLIGMMFYLAPLAMANRDFRSTMAMLPVTAGEKMAFLLLYLWGYMLLVTNGINFCVTNLVSLVLPSVECQGAYLMYQYKILLTPLTIVAGVVMSWGFEVFCLYGVVSARSNRMGRGILYAALGFGIYIVTSIVAGVWGVIRFFETNPDAADTFAALGKDTEYLRDGVMTPELMDSILVFVREIMEPLYGMMCTVALICMCVLISKLYKKLKIGGF